MKRTINHLPKSKQKELYQIVSAIQDGCDDVEMIVLFGSYARGDWKEESNYKSDSKTGHKSDYDILVITREKQIAQDVDVWHEITKVCNELNHSTHVRIISQDIENVNIRLAEGQYFLTDIKQEGCLLFDSGNFKLARERELTSEERSRIAQDHFDHWFERARRFYRHFKIDIEENDYKGAAFQLHQSAEASYKTVLLVFTNYNPNEHYLKLLGELASSEDSSLNDIFPLKTKEDRERFRLLDYAYIGARYDPDFRITKKDLNQLAMLVKRLLDATERICKAKIINFDDKG
ncbi:MAG: HEPN domain-containing protein [Proteobacteria bacterium]|nr:HEPN domain-containing protein [Pseudomonadota bacterium]